MTPQTDWPAHAAAPNTHARVFELVQQYFPQPQNILACDVPCGAGSFSANQHVLAKFMKGFLRHFNPITSNEKASGHQLPSELRGEIPFFGEVIIYVMRKKCT